MIQRREDRANFGRRQGALARLERGNGASAYRPGWIAPIQPASLGVAKHQQYDLADMHGDGGPALLLDLVAQTLKPLRRHLLQL